MKKILTMVSKYIQRLFLNKKLKYLGYWFQNDLIEGFILKDGSVDFKILDERVILKNITIQYDMSINGEPDNIIIKSNNVELIEIKKY